jgi:hypothetical protein
LKRINEFDFYHLGSVLHPLSALKEETIPSEVFWDLFQARTALEALLKGAPLSLVVAKAQAEALLISIKSAQIAHDMDDKQRQAAAQEPLDFKAYFITENLKSFETVMAAELQTLDSYFVSKKGIYSTADLIERTEEAISESLRPRLPSQAILDFREAGKCLAFDVFTAAGFHVLRATDAVLRSYYAKFVGKPPSEKQRNWGAFLRVLGKCNPGPNPKTMSMVDQIRDLHRNPIIHPEDNLNGDEALVLFDLCKAAIIAMAMELG